MNKILPALLLAGLAGSALAQRADTVVLPMSYLGESSPLYELALKQSRKVAGRGFTTPTEMVQRHGPLMDDATADNMAATAVQGIGSDPVIQTVAVQPLAAVAGANFEGPGVGMPGFTMTGAPPDTTLAVGPSHVVAWVNSMYAMMNKTGTVLTLANGNVLFAGTGNLCDTTNQGDPILQYDRQADRWVMSQFAFTVSGSNIVAPYLQCIAVSTTNNPLGSYYRYAITFGSTSPNGFNDYGKLGIFPDGYYTAYNVFGGSPAGGNTGAALCASDRVKMLAGDPTATTLCAPTAAYAGGSFGFLPMDVDGATAPTTTSQGNIFMRFSTTGPSLRMIKLKPNFAASTVTITDGLGGASGSFVTIAVGATTRACNGSAGACVAQPGTTTKLDTLADRLMYRLAYRNRGGVDSLMVTHAVDPDGAGTRSAAVRWYEIRSPFASTPTLFQNATFDQGATGDRWMGSLAMDKMGNMLMGYSYANSTAGTKPSINIAGRLRTDLRNQMRAEQTMYAGSGSQTVTSGGTALTRWGDYTTMQIDPSDDCTFWYIGQYLSADGAFNWRTRIGSYKYASCT